MDWKPMIEQAIRKLKPYRYVALVLLIGLVLMCLPGGEAPAPEPRIQEADTRQPELEELLAALLSKIEGAGRVEVLLTQASGSQTLYQSDDEVSSGDAGNNTRRKTVLVSNGSREEAGLVRQVLPPQYRGAVVVCQGADSPKVRLAIVEAVSNATGLASNRISVLKMK